MNRKEVAYTFGMLFTRIASLVGLKGQIDPLQKEEIWNAIFSEYLGLSFEEIYKAFQMDRKGVYGDVTDHFQFFDVSYVCSVLKKYRQWLQDTQRANNITIYQLPEKQSTMTEEEKEINVLRWLREHFQEYKDTQKMPVLSVPVYDTLLIRGVMKPYFASITEKDRQLMRKETEKRLRQAQTETTDKQEFSLMRTLYEKYMNNETDPNGRILRLKKEITLQFFYNHLISQGEELSDLLDKAPNPHRSHNIQKTN